eukprot:1109343-Pelagomonas_calceolata.AAC.1
MVSKTALTTLKKAGRAELQSLAALSELQHSLHHVLAEAQAMQQLGSAGLEGGGVQLVQAIVDGLQALIIRATLKQE